MCATVLASTSHFLMRQNMVEIVFLFNNFNGEPRHNIQRYRQLTYYTATITTTTNRPSICHKMRTLLIKVKMYYAKQAAPLFGSEYLQLVKLSLSMASINSSIIIILPRVNFQFNISASNFKKSFRVFSRYSLLCYE